MIGHFNCHINFYAKKYPESISGIILASGIYKNDSNKAKKFSMEKIIGKKIKVDTLIVHHEKDVCRVTQYKYAKSFFKKLKSTNKRMITMQNNNSYGIPLVLCIPAALSQPS